jgi:hypothetical protein
MNTLPYRRLAIGFGSALAVLQRSGMGGGCDGGDRARRGRHGRRALSAAARHSAAGAGVQRGLHRAWQGRHAAHAGPDEGSGLRRLQRRQVACETKPTGPVCVATGATTTPSPRLDSGPGRCSSATPLPRTGSWATSVCLGQRRDRTRDRRPDDRPDAGALQIRRDRPASARRPDHGRDQRHRRQQGSDQRARLPEQHHGHGRAGARPSHSVSCWPASRRPGGSSGGRRWRRLPRSSG